MEGVLWMQVLEDIALLVVWMVCSAVECGSEFVNGCTLGTYVEILVSSLS
jgi:hypothetical protein